MARKPRKNPARSAAGGANAQPNGGNSRPASARERIIESFIRLLARKPIEEIGFAEIAAGAGVSLSELRAAFGQSPFLRLT
jgi:AcrR family transcriptional regulator